MTQNDIAFVLMAVPFGLILWLAVIAFVVLIYKVIKD